MKSNKTFRSRTLQSTTSSCLVTNKLPQNIRSLYLEVLLEVEHAVLNFLGKNIPHPVPLHWGWEETGSRKVKDARNGSSPRK